MKNALFKWVDGIHQTGYRILTLAYVSRFTPVPFDCYLIEYPPGSSIPPHKDVLKSGNKHFRVNLILTHPEGGEFVVEKAIFKSKWLNIFRPDLYTHSVTEVKGTRSRYVFSIGWCWEH